MNTKSTCPMMVVVISSSVDVRRFISLSKDVSTREGVVADHLASVHDFLSAHHHSACQWNAAQQVVFLGFAFSLFVDDVGLYIVVEVAAGEQRSLGSQFFVGKEMLIGGYRRVERLDRHAFHVLSADDSDGAGRILEDAVVLRGVDDAHLIDIVQFVGYKPHKFIRQTGYSLRKSWRNRFTCTFSTVGFRP